MSDGVRECILVYIETFGLYQALGEAMRLKTF